VRCPESLEPEFQSSEFRKGFVTLKHSVGTRSFVE